MSFWLHVFWWIVVVVMSASGAAALVPSFRRRLKSLFIRRVFFPTSRLLQRLVLPWWLAKNNGHCRFVDVAGRSARVLPHSALPPVPPQHLRVVMISDTHTKHELLTQCIPKAADVLLHCGDILLQDRAAPLERSLTELRAFDRWLSAVTASHAHKPLVIAGNHDKVCEVATPAQCQDAMPGAIYLQHSAAFVPLKAKPPAAVSSAETAAAASDGDSKTPLGIVVYGSPNSRLRQSGNRAFQFDVNGTENPYAALTAAATAATGAMAGRVDVLMTHDQPLQHGTYAGGCARLRACVSALRPQVHVFGHVHNLYGICFKRYDEQRLVGVNASTVDSWILPVHLPVVMDVPARRIDPVRDVAQLNALPKPPFGGGIDAQRA